METSETSGWCQPDPDDPGLQPPYDPQPLKEQPAEMIDLPSLVSRSHGTSGGVELADEVVDRLGEEAEEGYDPEQFTTRERAVKLREMAAIERNEAAEIESDRDVSPGRAQTARLARQLARDFELAADRLDPDQGDATSLLAGTILLVSYVHVRKS